MKPEPEGPGNGFAYALLICSIAALVTAFVSWLASYAFRANAQLFTAPVSERTESRNGYRNGYKPRTLTAAVGDLNLLVPQDRDGTFSTQLCQKRDATRRWCSRSWMYVKGVSTRKVASITEKLCGKSFSSQQVSRLAKDLDTHVENWRTRPLEGMRPCLLVDARYEKVRNNGRVISQGILIVIAINPEGKREIIAAEVAHTENTTMWL